MLGRPQLRVYGAEIPGSAGYRSLSGRRRLSDATAGNITLPVAGLLAGWIDRSGPGAGYADVFPAADAILAALPDLTRGDSFDVIITSSVAFANTITAGTGITLAGTTSVAASSGRQYLITLLSEPKRSRVMPGSTTNASPTLTNIATSELANIGVGMLVTGTNVPAATSVVGVNLATGTVTMSANATGTADLTAFTFTPQFEVRGMFVAGN
jgi:hypothetical protein